MRLPLIALLLLIAPVAVHAGEAGHHPARTHVLAKFDADHDGKLSDSERAATKAACRAKVLAKWDADHDGSLSDGEKAAMKAHLQETALKKWDANRDGALDDQEKAARRAKIAAHRQHRQD